jgi:N-acetylmuramoyl-L-alanine amidase
LFMTVKIKKAALWGAAILALLAAVLFGRQLSKPAMSGNTRTLVIDPGHGGIDGGAVAADGTKESAINLAVGLRMRAIAGLYGVDAVMTRETEESGVSVSEYSEHGDLVRRAEFANSVPGAVLVSVHQNNFPHRTALRRVGAVRRVRRQQGAGAAGPERSRRLRRSRQPPRG